MCQLEIEQGSGKFRRVKLRHVFQLFSKANELHGQSELLQDGTTTPPLALPSSFARTMPVHPAASEKPLA